MKRNSVCQNTNERRRHQQWCNSINCSAYSLPSSNITEESAPALLSYVLAYPTTVLSLNSIDGQNFFSKWLLFVWWKCSNNFRFLKCKSRESNFQKFFSNATCQYHFLMDHFSFHQVAHFYYCTSNYLEFLEFASFYLKTYCNF